MWLMLIGGAVGAAVAGYGLVVLASDGRRGNRRQGLQALCFGAALVLLAVGSLFSEHDLSVPTYLAVGVSVALTGLAVFRFRQRTGER